MQNDARQAALKVLKHWYGNKWHIRCTPSLWIATAMDPDTPTEKTVIEFDLDEFISRLEHPHARPAKPLHPLLERLGWERTGTAWRSPEGGGDLLA
ncbi:hypothetical protein J0910_17160 [Nocardiopsis sp. CNT-189]|uniref:hypothetical protein n=1 Tax=Nocardiopsis oceanisediminis TaxID=2816862 RepID=UPI003B2A882A